MSSDIFNTYAESYNSAVTLNLQQKGSRLASAVRIEFQEAEREYYDRIGPTEAFEVNTRHGDTPLADTYHERRCVVLKSVDWADLIDRADNVRLLSDPVSAYAVNAAYALGRKKDQRIIEAAMGTSLAGQYGQTPVELPSSQTIDSSYFDGIKNKTSLQTGLTIDKLRYARELLDDADVDDDEEQYCIVTAKQISDLLRTTEVTSEEYNSVKALVDGRIDTFMGFKFRRVSSSLLPKNDDNRSVLCWSKSGILLGMKQDIKTDVGPRKDKRMAIQVYASLDCGATRMEERKVVRILCNEKA